MTFNLAFISLKSDYVLSMYLQSLLSKDKQQKIYEVGRNDVVEEHTKAVDELVMTYVAIRVPQRAFEGKLSDSRFADV